ncbi:909_t:CDS:2 [Diversispora eburnea]|uniref:909_t:CDS:1 n=1 Tax=Diversispora eburnea TaxID=1213867 RepID=A0A9N8Z3E0_9GLOM|nr:909_t:CDS:2 [Diversispora eburnea]
MEENHTFVNETFDIENQSSTLSSCKNKGRKQTTKWDTNSTKALLTFLALCKQEIKAKDSERQSGGVPVVLSFRTELDDILDENRATFKPVTLISSASTENTEITINRQTKKHLLCVTSTETSTLIESSDEDRQPQNSGTLYTTNTLSPVLNYTFQNPPQKNTEFNNSEFINNQFVHYNYNPNSQNRNQFNNNL